MAGRAAVSSEHETFSRRRDHVRITIKQRRMQRVKAFIHNTAHGRGHDPDRQFIHKIIRRRKMSERAAVTTGYATTTPPANW